MGFNPIHIIFGLKLRQARLAKGLSVTELAERSQLSPSYITEIEKGRKYPKADKIMRLAEALGYAYDELVSLRLEPPLSFLETPLTSQLLQDFPLELFGVDPSSIVEVLTRSPAEMSALVKAFQDIARGYAIREEHFYLAALRSYQELNQNTSPTWSRRHGSTRRRRVARAGSRLRKRRSSVSWRTASATALRPSLWRSTRAWWPTGPSTSPASRRGCS